MHKDTRCNTHCNTQKTHAATHTATHDTLVCSQCSRMLSCISMTIELSFENVWLADYFSQLVKHSMCLLLQSWLFRISDLPGYIVNSQYRQHTFNFWEIHFSKLLRNALGERGNSQKVAPCWNDYIKWLQSWLLRNSLGWLLLQHRVLQCVLTMGWLRWVGSLKS